MKGINILPFLFVSILMFGCEGEDDAATALSPNMPPTANAGLDQIVDEISSSFYFYFYFFGKISSSTRNKISKQKK